MSNTKCWSSGFEELRTVVESCLGSRIDGPDRFFLPPNNSAMHTTNQDDGWQSSDQPSTMKLL